MALRPAPSFRRRSTVRGGNESALGSSPSSLSSSPSPHPSPSSSPAVHSPLLGNPHSLSAPSLPTLPRGGAITSKKQQKMDKGMIQVMIGSLFDPKGTPPSIDFHHCFLSPDDISAIAQGLKANAQVQSLNLEGNDISNASITVLSDALRTNTSLTELSLSGNKFDAIGLQPLWQALAENQRLTYLDISHNALRNNDVVQKHMFDAIVSNKSLRYLNINNSYFTDASLSVLSVALSTNNYLQELRLGFNLFGGDDKSLSMQDNEGISALADVLRTSNSLRTLDLSGTVFTGEALPTLSNAIAMTQCLKKLVLQNINTSGIEFERFVDGVRGTKSLESLDLSGNNPLPSNIANLFLSPLKRVLLERCGMQDRTLRSIGNSLKVNSHLTKLNISSNSFSKDALEYFAESIIPNTILSKLELRAVPFVGFELTHFMYHTKSLRSLNLSDSTSSITIVADLNRFFEAVALTKTAPLREIYLENMSLDDSSAAALLQILAKSTQLRRMTLRGNNFSAPRIEQFLDVFPTSVSLIQLDLGDIADDRLLTKELSGRGLTEFPAMLFQLPDLTSLNLSSNKITIIPAKIGDLVNLVHLDISNNQAMSLPTSLGNLSKLKTLKFANNPLRTPPKEVRDKSVKHILAYLRDLGGNSPPIYRTKIMVVGPPNSGKSSLVRGLKRRMKTTKRKAPDRVVYNDSVFVEEVSVDLPSGDKKGATQPLALSFWDFSRQEINFGTSSLYFTDRTVYVIAFDLTREDPDRSVEYWLQTIAERTGKSKRDSFTPIIIVGTHVDMFPDINIVMNKLQVPSSSSKSINDVLRKRFPSIQAIMGVSMTDSNAPDVGEVPDTIMQVLTTQSYLGETVPMVVLEFAKLILMEKQRLSIRNWRDTQDLGYYCNIVEQKELVEAVTTLANWGEVLWFDKPNLSDAIFLDMTFISRHFMTPLIVNRLNCVEDGIIQQKDHNYLWSDQQITVALRLLLMRILIDQGVFVPLPAKRIQTATKTLGMALNAASVPMVLKEADFFYVPCLLSEWQPKLRLLWFDFYDPRLYQYFRRLCFDFIPLRFWDRFVFELIRLSDEVHALWRYGVLCQRGVDFILVQVSPESRSVTIGVRGPERPVKALRAYLETALLVFDYTNQHSIGLSQEAPCPHCLRIKSKNVQSFDLAKLELIAAAGSGSNKGSWTTTCPGDDYSIDISEIAPDISLSEVRSHQVNYENLEFWQEIGRGAFGTIYEGYCGDQSVAVKTIDASTASEDKKLAAFQEFSHELHIMASCQHPMLVNLISFTLEPFSIVMEYCPYGNLYEFVIDPNSRRDWPYNLRIALDVARGMHAMHSADPPFAHFDLKSPNILLYSMDFHAPVVAKIADFGLTQPMYVPTMRENAATREVGNPTWLAPEIMRGQEFNQMSDVYSFGIVLWEIVSRQHPYSEYRFDFMFELEDMVKNGARPSFRSYTPPVYRDLVVDCWHDDPNKRPRFFTCCERLVEMAWELTRDLRLPSSILVDIWERSAVKAMSSAANDQQQGVVKIRQDPLFSVQKAFKGEFMKQLVPREASDNKGIYSMVNINDRVVCAGIRSGSILVFDSLSGVELAKVPNVAEGEVSQLFMVNDALLTVGRFPKMLKARFWKAPDEDSIRSAQALESINIPKTGVLKHKVTTLSGETPPTRARFFQLRNNFLFAYDSETDKVPAMSMSLLGATIEQEESKKYFKFKLIPSVDRARAALSRTQNIMGGGSARSPSRAPDSDIPMFWRLSTTSNAEGAAWVDALTKQIKKKPPTAALLPLSDYIENVTAVQHIPSRKQIWAGSLNGTIKVFSADTYKLQQEIQLGDEIASKGGGNKRDLYIFEIVEHPSAILLAVSKWIVAVHPQTFTVLALAKAHEPRINQLILVNGKLWSCGEDKTLKVWEVSPTGLKNIQTIATGHKLFALLHVGDEVWAGGFDQLLHIYDVQSMTLSRSLQNDQKHTDSIKSLIRWRNTVWVGNLDETITVWI